MEKRLNCVLNECKMICVMYLNARYVHCMIKQRMPRQNTGSRGKYMMYVQLATFYHHSYLLNREMYAGAQPLARTPLYVVLVVFCSDQDQPPRSIYGEYEYKIPLCICHGPVARNIIIYSL